MAGLTEIERKEAERRQAIEVERRYVLNLLGSMENASPGEAELLAKQIRDRFTGSNLLPIDFKRNVGLKARELECSSNMRLCDNLLRQASRAASLDNATEKNAKLGDARKVYAKACSLGSDEKWRKAVMRLIDTIMLTGGVQRKGPTLAKPADIAPRAPNRAKV